MVRMYNIIIFSVYKRHPFLYNPSNTKMCKQIRVVCPQCYTVLRMMWSPCGTVLCQDTQEQDEAGSLCSSCQRDREAEKERRDGVDRGGEEGGLVRGYRAGGRGCSGQGEGVRKGEREVSTNRKGVRKGRGGGGRTTGDGDETVHIM